MEIGDRNEGGFTPTMKYTGYYPHGALQGLLGFQSFRYLANIFCVTQLHTGIETANIIRYDGNLYQMIMNDTDYPKQLLDSRALT